MKKQQKKHLHAEKMWAVLLVPKNQVESDGAVHASSGSNGAESNLHPGSQRPTNGQSRLVGLLDFLGFI